jgi:CRAL/TRIO domain
MEFIKPHLEWRAKPQPLTPFIESIMVNDILSTQNAGFLFTFGKDKQFRPIVYVRLGVMKDKKKNGLDDNLKYPELDPAIDWILTLIRKECYLSYFVENWIMIIDAADMGIFSFPVKFFTNLIGMTQINHPSCLHKMFIVNTASSMGAVWKMASRRNLILSSFSCK